MRRLGLGAGVVAVLACAACGRTRAPEPAAAASPTELVPSLQVEVRPDSVNLVLHVTNASAGPVTLHFPTAQTYDFRIETESGEPLWRWSADRLFPQVVTTRTLAAGETLTASASWAPGSRTGQFVAFGVLPAEGQRIEQRASFAVPGS